LNCCEWIKPKFSSQFDVGEYKFAVGVECNEQQANGITSFLDLPSDAKLKVDLNHPYYMEDNSVVPNKRLALQKTLQLQVAELPMDRSSLCDDNNPWILDICLDYFACRNPYFEDLEDSYVLNALINIMKASKFTVKSDTSQLQLSPMVHQREILKFHDFLKDYLHAGDFLGQISDFFEDEEYGKGLLFELRKAINGDEKLLKCVVEMIPYWSMPHDVASSSFELMNTSLELVKEDLRKRQSRHSQLPLLVTIARSSDDGFTPLAVVEYLQTRVLSILHDAFCTNNTNIDMGITTKTEQEVECSCKKCCLLQIVRDYGEFEGSTIP
jgi:hypothetical protein